MRAKIAAGNWKMNGTAAALSELDALAALLPATPPTVVLCPPAPLLYRASEAARAHGIAIGAQDCHMDASGPFTGDISATMVADTGASHVIVGHSERRDAHEETNSDVRAKARQAWAAGLTAIICIGESGDDRAANNTLDIIAGQLAGSLPDGATATNTVIAYEPIWAIGTGKVPTLAEIIDVHDFIRTRLCARCGATEGDGIPLLYGGSVKPDNARTIFKAANVDGALVGGASLKASDFAPIITALSQS
ncbi:triose-phosphate isomerase [Sulfitobacter sp. TSTF-M16]|uniref:Triosephosphate isomerase n=1 Tax=Sulfitobacter aestuariivivens TaxID=2766981 RepID=A0A927D334_9RHOB|nr:triose-phosphate isomerase [Sulfitobacter aestuariivivens]MBD3663014.1 triose-phosphate isomerase [Sulfitobacter aestuariivivens]